MTRSDVKNDLKWPEMIENNLHCLKSSEMRSLEQFKIVIASDTQQNNRTECAIWVLTWTAVTQNLGAVNIIRPKMTRILPKISENFGENYRWLLAYFWTKEY